MGWRSRARHRSGTPRDHGSDGAQLLTTCLGYLKPFWRLELLGLVITALVAALSLSQPWIQKLLIDGIVAGGSKRLLARIVVLLLATVGGRIALSFCQKILFTGIREKATRNLRTSMSGKLIHLGYEEVLSRNPGDIVSTLMQDVEAVGSLYGDLLVGFLTDLLLLGAVVAVMIYIDMSLAIVTLAAMLLMALTFRNLTRPIERVSLGVQDATAEASVMLNEFWKSIPEVRLLNCYSQAGNSLLEAFEGLRKARFRKSFILSLISTNEFTIWLITAAMIWMAGTKVIAGRLTMGDLVAFWGYTNYALGPINGFLAIGSTVRASMGAARRLFGLVENGPFEDPDRGGPFPGMLSEVEFSGVHFEYEPGKPILADCNLRVREGEWVGIIGASGCGKSTAAAILAGLLHACSGEVRIGGIGLPRISPRELRGSIGFAMQSPHVFLASAFANIEMARPGASMDEVREAAKRAGIHDYIEALPEGYQTRLGEGGRQLSGGERQRIALARLFLKDPRIVILDEATSAIDPETADAISVELARHFKGRTGLIISHHPRALQHADRLLALERGRLREVSVAEASSMAET